MQVSMLKSKLFIKFSFTKFTNEKRNILLNTPINTILLIYKILFSFINSLKVVQLLLFLKYQQKELF